MKSTDKDQQETKSNAVTTKKAQSPIENNIQHPETTL